MSGLAERIADRLRTHQWHTPPEYHAIHAISAHNRHQFNADCAICVGDVDRIAAVAASAVGEHVASQLGDVSHPVSDLFAGKTCAICGGQATVADGVAGVFLCDGNECMTAAYDKVWQVRGQR
ncbi:hypothetical protein [Micromonospora sediminicola]|uniref:hypothetical protein n=1 Tax=Micromonospora sediminicola TaxID=946078 RepID=UPI0037A2181B